eukprot:g1195.t1
MEKEQGEWLSEEEEEQKEEEERDGDGEDEGGEAEEEEEWIGVTGRAFSCGNICGQTLDCKNHKCESPCHPGPCRPCSRIPKDPQPCACGKISQAPGKETEPSVWRRNKCTDPLPTCAQICAKRLPCGLHTCKLPCHDGPCLDCKVTYQVKCRCQRAHVTLSCAEFAGRQDLPHAQRPPVLCAQMCKNRLRCGSHRCRTRCCGSSGLGPDGPDHLCLLPCEKPLECGRHNCPRTCHAGKCGPCGATFSTGLSCTCGHTIIPGPLQCGMVKKVMCTKPCSRVRANCPHPCIYQCHEDPCPLCVKLVSKYCAGQHVVLHSVPCHVQSPSCGTLCKLPLPCGLHVCNRTCHAPPCVPHVQNATGELVPASASSSCAQPCGLPREHCGHSCNELCHPLWSCPNVKCTAKMTVYCDCKRLHAKVVCGVGGTGPDAMTLAGVERKLPCDEQCKMILRNKRLANALQLNAEGGPTSTGPFIPYPRLLLSAIMEMARPSDVANVEKTFDKFLATPYSDKHCSQMLGVMPRDNRWLVHQMAPYYGLKTESFDKEPRRSILLSRNPSSAPPAMPFSQ